MPESRLVIEENIPLAGLTTLQVGGPARYYARVGDAGDVRECISWAGERSLPILVLGGGSNMLIADSGFPGLVMHIDLQGTAVREEGDAVFLTVGAGEQWAQLVDKTVERGWSGIECLAGIPGLAGSTPIQNVGAYGQEVKETISSVDALDRETGEIRTFSNTECDFAYRNSRFKTTDAHRYIILSVTFRLIPDGKPTVRYAELERQLAVQGVTSPGLSDVRRVVLELRRQKSMLVDPDDPNSHSAGSFFLNPIISEQAFNSLCDAVAPSLKPGESVPGYTASDGRVKVPAAWLIERAGFSRGYTRGNAGLSAYHTLALINRGRATAQEIVDLALEIRDGVQDRFGVTMTPEPTMVGISLDGDTQSQDA